LTSRYAPEPIDRLLGIADDEQLARLRANRAPVAFRGVVGGKQQEDLRLQRIGVLELVDEQVSEATLEVGAHGRDVAQEIARAHQQVDEVERAGIAFELFVTVERAAQLDV